MMSFHPKRIGLWLQDRRRPRVFGRVAINHTRSESGFSLVEVMVAMVIGLLGIIVMLQMFSLFEGQKRTTGSGDDAISSGAVSLYGVQRMVQQSGWGISALPLIGCGLTSLISGGASIPLVPVTINHPLITGHDANTDTLLVMSGNGNGTVEGDKIRSGAGVAYTLNNPTGFKDPDRVVAVPKTRLSPCALALTRVTGPTAVNVPVTLVVAPAFTVATNDLLFNLGTQPTVRAYAIRNGNLTVCDYTVNNCGTAANNADSTIWVPVANNVVSMRAEYGRDTTLLAMDGIVDVWDQTALWTQSPWVGGLVSSDTAKDTQACALLRMSAVRIVLVARNSQPEKTLDWPALNDHVADHVFPDPRTWMGNLVVTLPSPSATWPTWKDFRYKTFQTVIPLRNITSQGAVKGC
jgi:type IV pilus assembly protein PilW